MSTVANPPVEVEHDQYRLPTNVKATHYDVAIKTDLEKLTFQGFAKIRYSGNYPCLECTLYSPFFNPPSLDIVVGASAITLNTSNLDLGTA